MDIPKRFYPQEFPEVGDIIVAQVTKIEEYYVYCHLLEYGCEGMVSLNELSRHKKYNIKHVTSIGRIEYIEVINIDKVKGYIDLSKIKVKDEEKEQCAKRYALAKKLHTLFTRLSHKTGVDLVSTLLWENYDEGAPDGNFYVNMCNDRTWQDNVQEHYQIIDEFEKVFEIKPKKRTASFEMQCYSPEGIEAIKEAIQAGLSCATEQVPIEFMYTAKSSDCGGIYEFTVTSIVSKDVVTRILQEAVDAVRTSISRYRFTFKARPIV